VHLALRLLPDRHQQAGGVGPRRSAPRGRVRANHRPDATTGVTRDDLADDEAWLYAETVRQFRAVTANLEGGPHRRRAADPDFDVVPGQLAEVFSSCPQVLGPQRRDGAAMFKRIRPGFRYERPLKVIIVRLQQAEE
jgi:lipoate synthase